MSTLRVNVKSKTTGKIRRETRDGREKIIVPSATLPDNVVMNGILYPAEEIEASYKGLEGTPAPLGHPNLNGKFCAANHTEAFIRYGVGAYNENVRRVDGRVWMDKVIDVAFAQQTERGQELLNAIEKGDPIHSSTGLVCRIENADGKKVARSIHWDHDAILLGEKGAATPEQGVGLLVNHGAVADGNEIDVLNSSLEEAERDFDWAVDHAARAAERMARLPLIERIKALILGEVNPTVKVNSSNEEDDDMAVSEEQFKALSDKVDSLAGTVGGLGEAVSNAVTTALKPVIEAQEALANAAKATEEAEKAKLVDQIVNANRLPKEAAEELSLASLRAIANALTPEKKGAAPIIGGGFKPQQNSDNVSTFKAPEAK